MSVQEPIPPERVAEELERVLARREFHASESLLQRLFERLLPHGQGLESSTLVTVLQVVLALALAALLVWFVRQLLRGGAPATVEVAADGSRERLGPRLCDLASASRRARAAGDARLALRLLFEAVLLALGGSGDLELCATWTNRELVRRGRHAPEARALLEQLVRELEPKEFGRAAIEPGDLARLEALLAPHLEAAGGEVG